MLGTFIFMLNMRGFLSGYFVFQWQTIGEVMKWDCSIKFMPMLTEDFFFCLFLILICMGNSAVLLVKIEPRKGGGVHKTCIFLYQPLDDFFSKL